MSCGNIYHTTIGKTIFLHKTLDYCIFLIGGNAYVSINRKTEFHDVAENVMIIWITGYPVDYVIGTLIVKPFTVLDNLICLFWRWEKSEISNNETIFNNYISTIFSNIIHNNRL